MPYVPPVDWEDTPSVDTPLNDANITAMETALAAWASYAEFRVNTTPVASATASTRLTTIWSIRSAAPPISRRSPPRLRVR